MATLASVLIGVDVGGTHTDAVVMQDKSILGCFKTQTTEDVMSGVINGIDGALKEAAGDGWRDKFVVQRVHIGTTQFVNAVVQMRHLARVAVIRLCGPASTQLPPFVDFPQDLKEVISGPVFMLDGGFHFDGQREISTPVRTQVEDAINKVKAAGIQDIVVSSVFSPINDSHEIQVGEWIQILYPEASITLSHKVAQIGLLLRENSAILNQSLKPLAARVIQAFQQAFTEKQLHCPFFLTQNDGTLLSSRRAQEMPVLTFASGPTNSMRGAAFLSGERDAIVADIGGTSADAGVLVKGFPRPASTKVQVGGVQTNFQMPDTVSIALGGGSKVKTSEDGKVTIGPESVGYALCDEGLVFGGKTLTTTDIAVASGHAQIGTQKGNIRDLSPELVSSAMAQIYSMMDGVVNKVKTSAEEVPLILVGGGSDLISSSWLMPGVSKLIKPPHYNVANAVGAALSQVAGTVDILDKITEDVSQAEIKERAKQRAIQQAIEEGADPSTVQILSIEEVPLTYLPGNVTRVMVKAVGDLATTPSSIKVSHLAQEKDVEKAKVKLSEELKSTLVTEKASTPTAAKKAKEQASTEATSTNSNLPDPHIDKATGEWLLNACDIECIAIGAGILGCGGGGSPYYGQIRLLEALKQGKKLRVKHPLRFARECGENDRAVAMCYMGAPTVIAELMYTDVEAACAITALKQLYSHGGYEAGGVLRNTEGVDVKTVEDKVTYVDDYKPSTQEPKYPELNVKALYSDEIGGCNSIEPLVLGAALDLPVLDCDTMGRAFPELQMCSHFIHGVKCYPMVLGDSNGRAAVALSVKSPKDLEDHFRDVCVQMGCSSATVGPPLTGEEISHKTVLYSISRAWRLGRAVLTARMNKTPPVQAIIKFEGGRLLLTGKVIDVKRKTEGGFAKGEMKLEGFGDYEGLHFLVLFQNENLVVKKLANSDQASEVLGTVPDLLTVVDVETGEPIATDEQRYGLRVAVLGLPAPPILTSEKALKVVGPQAFGFSKEEASYQSIADYVAHDPVPLP